MKRVTGIGGIFFKTNDPEALTRWYQEHLGIELDPQGYVSFEWREKDDPSRKGSTAWGPFPADTDYFKPSSKPFMINYRVENLDYILEQLRKEGVTVEDKIQNEPYGRFAWLMDPEGNRIELWEAPK